MNKIALVAAALLLPISVLATTDASAENKATPIVASPIGTIQRGPIAQFPLVRGEFTVAPALRTGEVAGISCDKIEVVAVSTENVPCTPGPNNLCLATPTWTKSGKATGNIATGKCEYAVVVPENKPFTVGTGSDFHPAGICGNTLVSSSQNNIVFLANQPMPIVTHNFAITGIQYQHCPH